MAVAFRDYYEVLGVPRDADTEDIRRAYRKLARENHPDINKDPAAEDRFKEISEAYEVLRDEERRRQYDRWRAASEQDGPDMSGADGFRGAARETVSETSMSTSATEQLQRLLRVDVRHSTLALRRLGVRGFRGARRRP